MSQKAEKKFRRALKEQAQQLFTDFMNEVQVMTFRERFVLAIKILCGGK